MSNTKTDPPLTPERAKALLEKLDAAIADVAGWPVENITREQMAALRRAQDDLRTFADSLARLVVSQAAELEALRREVENRKQGDRVVEAEKHLLFKAIDTAIEAGNTRPLEDVIDPETVWRDALDLVGSSGWKRTTGGDRE